MTEGRDEASGRRPAESTEPETDVEVARRERDDALRDLAATTRMSARQRVRFETAREDLDRVTAERDRARRDLERISRRPAVRAGRALVGAYRSIRDGARSVMGRRRVAPGPAGDQAVAGAGADRTWTSATFRPAFLDGVRRPVSSAGRPLHVAIVLSGAGAATPRGDRSLADAFTRGLADLGYRTTLLEVADRRDPVWDPTIDVAVVVAPGLARRRIPRDVVSVAAVHDRVDRWLEDESFDDHDIVLVDDDAVGLTLEAGSSQAPTRVPGSIADPVAATFLRDALAAWAEAPKVAIHIGPLTWEAAAGWGDTPFGRALQKAFGRRGWPATVHVFAERDSAPARRADIALHVFGARAPQVRDGQLSLLWVISHPDRITSSMCEPYGAVFAASDLFARQLAERVRPRVVALHQATDPERFHPDPTGPAHELLFVGNSRKVRRRILADLAGTSRDVAVYGGGWTPELLDPHRLRGEWIPNDQLRRYYSSAGIVLCDHYDDMRDEGFISNRAYDALACGAFVISDRVPGIEVEFDGGLVTYGDADELGRLVERYLDDPDERRQLAARGRAAVLARHTFAQRVDTIIEEVTRLQGAGRDTST